MSLRPSRSTRTDTLFPCTTLFLSKASSAPCAANCRDIPQASDLSLARPMISPRFPAIKPLITSQPPDYLFGRCRSPPFHPEIRRRTEEHTSELQSLMRISYAVYCLKKKNNITDSISTTKKK